MSSLSIGVSGLQVSQRLLDVTGQNIANANTPNYHRQIVDLAERIVGAPQGVGVEINGLSRVVSRSLEDAVVRNTSASTKASAQLDGLRQLQSYLDPSDGSLNDALLTFFNEAERLSTQPDDMTRRRIVLASANDLANRLNRTADDLNGMRAGIADQIESSVTKINELTAEIARLNRQLRDTTVGGDNPNGLLDRRDQALAQLSELADVRVIPQDLQQVNILVAGTPVVLNSDAIPLSVSIDSNNQFFVHVAKSTQAMDIAGGKLAGFFSLANSTLPTVRAQFDELVRGLVTAIDHIHATGLGLDGPMSLLTSQRPLAQPNLPLDVAKLAFPPKAGDLYITVTEQATGKRTLSRVAVNPSQTLAGLATAISAVPNVQAVVDPQAGTLSIIARPGYGFDFTGNLSTSPDAQTITGTATPSITGHYTGATNGVLDFRVVGSGTVGATPNLSLEVRNSAGALISTLNIGQGYEAGTNLPDVLGVKISLPTGTLNNSDSFQVNVAADPDTAGILAALGLNTFFVGSDAATLSVRFEILDHPDRFALSGSGQPGDGGNLIKLVTLRDQTTMDNRRATFAEFLANVIGDVGNQVQDTTTRADSYEALGAQLEEQRQSVSGVDTNEELIKLVQYQRAYQMSAHFIAATNEVIDDLLRLA